MLNIEFMNLRDNPEEIKLCLLPVGTDYDMRRDARKPFFGISNQVRLKPGCIATEDG